MDRILKGSRRAAELAERSLQRQRPGAEPAANLDRARQRQQAGTHLNHLPGVEVRKGVRKRLGQRNRPDDLDVCQQGRGEPIEEAADASRHVVGRVDIGEVSPAMSSGVACIATNVGGNVEVLADCGELFPRGDAEALAKAIQGLLSQPEHRAELAQRGRARAEAVFALDQWVDAFADAAGVQV